MATAQDVMDHALHPEVGGEDSLPVKRRRVLRETSLGEAPRVNTTEVLKVLTDLENLIATRSCTPMTPLDLEVFKLGVRSHPEFRFYQLLAGTFEKMDPFELLAFEMDPLAAVNDTTETEQLCEAALRTAEELRESLQTLLRNAEHYNADYDFSERVRGLVASSEFSQSKGVESKTDALNVLLQVREYFNRTVSDDALREELEEQVRETFSQGKHTLKEGSSSDKELAQWLRANGPSILDRARDPDLLIAGGVGDEGGESMRTPIPGREEPSASMVLALRASNEQLMASYRTAKEEKVDLERKLKELEAQLKAAQSGSAPSSSRRVSTMFTVRNSNEYVRESDIENAIRSLGSSGATAAEEQLRTMMADVDSGYVTDPILTGARAYLASYAAEGRRVDSGIRRALLEYSAVRSAIQESVAQNEAARTRFERLSQTDPSEGLTSKPFVHMAMQSMLTELSNEAPEAYGRATLRGILRGPDRLLTSFANLVSLALLRRKVDFPDRYRPVNTAENIETRALKYKIQMMDFTVRFGSVMEHRP